MNKYFAIIKKVYWGSAMVKSDQIYEVFDSLEDANATLEREVYSYKNNLFEITNDLDIDIWDIKTSLCGTLRYSASLTFKADDIETIKIEYTIIDR